MFLIWIFLKDIWWLLERREPTHTSFGSAKFPFRFSVALSVLNATLYFCPITQQNLTNCESWTCEIWSSRKALLLLCFVAHLMIKNVEHFAILKVISLVGMNQQLFSKSVKSKSILLLNWPRKKYINVHKRIACLVKCEN